MKKNVIRITTTLHFSEVTFLVIVFKKTQYIFNCFRARLSRDDGEQRRKMGR